MFAASDLSETAPRPLADKLRPQTLSDVVGQDHLLGPDGALGRMLATGNLSSIILWGPPGVGKTTIARLLAQETDLHFEAISAIFSGVKDLRAVFEAAQRRRDMGQGTLLFVDEIHRFNRAQQDGFLPYVEAGTVTLVGATTENPSFEVIPALLSRCQVYVLNPFTRVDLEALLKRAIQSDTVLKSKKIELKETEALLRLSGGDGRKLLNIFELIVNSESSDKISITDEMVLQKVQQNTVLYDKTGEQHYDIISAFIKSIRGSDPNAAVYWLARMIEGGEDVKFIARRMLILASEDIGNANPTALVLANSTFQAVNTIGYPEARIILSQCATYLASSPKSNASYMAINRAQQKVKQTGDLSVPLEIRNAPTQLMKELNYGKGYQYAHDHQNNFVDFEFMPMEISGTTFYEPGNNPREKGIRDFLGKRWKGKYGY